MIDYRQCPFCGRLLEVQDFTQPHERKVGLVYLRVKCVTCNSAIEGAGVGREQALRYLDRSRDKRVGTKPGDWKIKVKGGRR